MSNKTNYYLTVFSSVGGQILTVLVGFFTVPISLHYWGHIQFGIWALLNSLLIYLGISNLGIDTATSVLMGKNPNVQQKWQVFRRALNIILVTSLLAAATFSAMCFFFPKWIYILGKFPDSSIHEVLWALFCLGIFYIINLPFSLVSAALTGIQKAYVNNTFTSLTPIFSFFALLITIYVKGNLVTYSVATGLITLGVNVVKSVVLTIVSRGLPSSESDVPKDEMGYSSLVRVGLRFFLIGLAAMVVWNTDNLVLSNILGFDAVSKYSVTGRLVSFTFAAIFLVNNSLLPLFAREFGQRNWSWISDKYSLFGNFGNLIGALVLVGTITFSADVISVWTGTTSYAGDGVVVFLGIYAFMLSSINLNSGLLNTFNLIKHGAYVAWAEAGLKLLVSVVFVRLFGIWGIAVGTVAGSLVPYIVLSKWIESRTMERLKYSWLDQLRSFSLAVPFVAFAFGLNRILPLSPLRFVIHVLAFLLFCGLYFAINRHAILNSVRILRGKSTNAS